MEQSNNTELLSNQTLIELEYTQVLNLIAKYCLTQKGKELIQAATPLNNTLSNAPSLLGRDSSLQQELNQLDELTKLLATDDIFPLQRLDDPREALKKAKTSGAVLDIAELKTIATMTSTAANLKHFMKSRKDKYPLLHEETGALYDNQSLLNQLKQTVDENGNILDNATPNLARIRKAIKDANQHLHRQMTRLAKEFADENYTQEDFYTLRDGRFVLPVRATHKRQLPGIVHGSSQSGATVYLEPTAAVELNNELAMLHSEELREIHAILKRLTAEISDNHAAITSLHEALAHIDALYAKAQHALKYGGVKPMLADEPVLELHNVYHPLLVHNLGIKNVVPLTISFSKHTRGHLISGPNAGGKTIALKTTGLAVLMAMHGFFPLGAVRLNNLSVYSYIGDGQSISANLSTFSAQLSRIKSMLDVASTETLILIDEICAGTDPQEGSALAAAVLDAFIDLKSFFIVTTHQSSLKNYALSLSNNDDLSI